MARLKWGQMGSKRYETGNRNITLYVYNPIQKTINGVTTNYYNGVAWNGITAIAESPSGAEATDLWANDGKYATLRSAEQFGGTIEAYTYPDEWEACDGMVTIGGVTLGQQKRKQFALAYITTIGNDTKLNDFGEKLHIIYNATVNPSERAYSTINDSPEAITFSWEYTTNPIDAGDDHKKVSLITIDSTHVDPELYAEFKLKLFGDTNTEAYLPFPKDVIAFFDNTIPENAIYDRDGFMLLDKDGFILTVSD